MTVNQLLKGIDSQIDRLCKMRATVVSVSQSIEREREKTPKRPKK